MVDKESCVHVYWSWGMLFIQMCAIGFRVCEKLTRFATWCARSIEHVLELDHSNVRMEATWYARLAPDGYWEFEGFLEHASWVVK